VAAKAEAQVKQHFQHALQRVDTASPKNSGKRHDIYPVYKVQDEQGFCNGLDKMLYWPAGPEKLKQRSAC
jgi:hypothetical protein